MLANHNAIEDSGYVIERSLRFSSASSQYLSRTPSVAGNQHKWTWSGWVKRGNFGSALPRLFGTANILFGGNAALAELYFAPNDSIAFYQYTGVTVYTSLTSSAVCRDPSAWYHIVLLYDDAQATATNRVKIYINGIQITSFSAPQYPTQNFNSFINGDRPHAFGVSPSTVGGYLDGYISEVNFIDGQALTPSSFGETNPTTGQWVAKKYTGTYGTNGFYLDFKDGTSTTTLGDDKSGNNNDWTLTNFTRSAGVNDCWMLDVPAGNGSASAVQPSGNYAVLDNLMPLVSGFTISKASLGYVTSVANSGHIRANFEISSGKWYWEYTVSSGNQTDLHGVCKTTDASNSNAWGEVGSVGYFANNGQKYVSGVASAYGSSFTSGDVIGVELDKDAGTITFFKNGVSQGVITLPTSDTLVPYFADGSSGLATSGDVNFGQRAWSRTPTAGFKALCTSNLTTPAIKKPSDHFNVQLSTGANIKTDSEALFTNELEWIKDRANTNNHQLIDSVRGTNAVLQSNTTAAETTYTAPSGSSVGWVWRASDSAAVINNVGNISSQVSANPTAGFSVVTYTGTGANATVGHGLGIAPKVVIVKSRISVQNWAVYHSNSNATPQNYYLFLSDTRAASALSTMWNNSPTSTNFAVGTSTEVNATGATYVAYCFAEIPGYSKFGSYTGNGSADGPNVTLGFKSRFVMIKRTDAAANWRIIDTARDTSNIASLELYPSLSNAEATFAALDIVANGFKIRNTDASYNASGGTYIYMAFAETPFNYANAR